MRIFTFTVKLIVALYFAKYVAVQVLARNYLYVVIIFTGSICFLLSSSRHKFILFSLMIFFSVAFPHRIPLPMTLIVELVAPVFCIFSFVEIFKRRQSLFSSKASLYFAAIGVLTLWSILHYINNPVLGRVTFGAESQSGGIQNYYKLFVGITIFLCSYWFFMKNELNVERWLFMFLILCLVVGNLYIIGFFKDLPILYFFRLGSHDITREGYQFSSIPLRRMATLGIACLFSFFLNKKRLFYFIIVFLNLLTFMTLGGGRAHIFAVILSISAYVALINRKYMFPFMSVLLIITGIYMMFLSNITFSELKYGRVFMTEGGLKQQSEARYYSFLYRFNVFQSSPVFGKGIGYKELAAQEDFFVEYPEAIKHIDYIKGQTGIGGHGAYLSTLSLFGIGGVFWLVVMLYGSIYYSYGIIRARGEFQNDVKLALFVFLYLISLSVGFIVGGQGYTSYELWFMAGIVAGLLSKDMEQGRIELQDSQEKLSI
jgi:hypothetical protein